MNTDIDDYDIQALVDDELGPKEAMAVMYEIHERPVLRARYETLIRQKKLLREWWGSLE